MTVTVLDLLFHFAFTAWGVYAGLWAWEFVHRNDGNRNEGDDSDSGAEGTD